MNYDIIIAGGSFAGLAAAVQLESKRVLLVEPHAIGAPGRRPGRDGSSVA